MLTKARWPHFTLWGLIVINVWQSVAEWHDHGAGWLINQFLWMIIVTWLIWETAK